MKHQITPEEFVCHWIDAFEAEAAACGLTPERIARAQRLSREGFDPAHEATCVNALKAADARVRGAYEEVDLLLQWFWFDGGIETPPPHVAPAPVLSPAVRYEVIRRMGAHGPTGDFFTHAAYVDARARACHRPFPLGTLELVDDR